MDTKQVFVGLMTLVCLVLFMVGCSTIPEAEVAKAKTEKAIQLAEKYMAEVETYLETAEASMEVATSVQASLVEFRTQYEAGEYVSALSELRGAIDTLKEAGVKVPSEIEMRIGQIETILAFTAIEE